MSDDSRRNFLRLLAATPAAGLTLGAGLGCRRARTRRRASDVHETDSGDGDAGGGPGDSRDAASADAGRRIEDAGPEDADAASVDGQGRPDAADAAGADDDGGTCEVTEDDVEGPFYRADAPQRSQLAPDDEPGTRLFVEGTVYGPDCRAPLEGALLDVWHADADGNYSTTTEDYRLRGQILADGEGRYALETIRPGHYPSGGSMRPAHLHFMVSKPGYAPLTTQMYFAGDPYLGPDDPCGVCSSDDSTLIVELTETRHAGETAYRGSFDIVLAADE